MIANIVRLLQQRKPEAPREWLQKLPDMAKRLEERLYRYAQSREEYEERSSLKQRLQYIALKMAEARPSPGGGAPRPPGPAPHQGGPPPPGNVPHTGGPPPPGNVPHTEGPPRGLPAKPGTKALKKQPSSSRGRQAVPPRPPPQGQYPYPNPPYPPGTNQSNAAYSNNGGYPPNSNYNSRPPAASRPDPSNSQHRQVLLQQQQRLLILRHASKCPVNPPHVCQSTPHCKQMKELWHHIAKCKDQHCQYAHCVSSRYVLSHYHRCNNPECEVCKPVKDAIQKQSNNEMNGNNRGGGRPSFDNYSNPRPTSQMTEQERLINQLQEERRKAEEAAQLQAQKVKDLEAKMELLKRQASDGSMSMDGKKQKKAPVKRAASSSGRGKGKKAAVNPSIPHIPAPTPPVYKGPAMPKPPQHMMSMKPNFSSNISIINAMTQYEIKLHIASLVRFNATIRPQELKNKLQTLLRKQQDQQFSYIFQKPVDPIAMEIPDYFEVIKRPMDLATVKKNLESGMYRSIKTFADDVQLVYDNAILYNPDTPDGVHAVAKQYAQVFIEDVTEMLRGLKDEEQMKRCGKNACRLCGSGEYTFEPPVYYCHGKCNQKIKRNAVFYLTPDFKMTWCQPCYSQLPVTVEAEDGTTIEKSKLEKKKNSEVAEEAWVQCNRCNRWYHQICALFNGKNDEAKDAHYFCPMCVLREMDRMKIEVLPKPKLNVQYAAADLPTCKFSDFIEKRIKSRVFLERQNQAKLEATSISNIPEPGTLTVRVVLHKDTEVYPRTNIEKIYKDAPYNYPRSFPHKVKCVLIFQSIDGVDVLFFALYIQSYGSDCPPPNNRCVYISYLDSVFYMEPRFMRTPVYQEVLIATLEYEKARGHTKAFIWACPPLAGDDYILYVHPKEQRNQKAEMLRTWYNRLLEDCRKEGIVISVDNLYDSYCRRVCNPCGIPNFDGDYWPGVAEGLVDDLEKEKIAPTSINARVVRKNNRSVGSNKKANKSKKAKGSKLKKKKSSVVRVSGRHKSSTVEEEEEEGEFEGVLFWPPPEPGEIRDIPQQDALTVKISDCIKQMKDDFFVVHFHHICAECDHSIDGTNELFWLPKEYKEGMGDLEHGKQKYAAPYALCHPCYLKGYTEEFDCEPEFEEPPMYVPVKEEVEDNAGKRKASEGATPPGRKKVKEEESVEPPAAPIDTDDAVMEVVKHETDSPKQIDVVESPKLEDDEGNEPMVEEDVDLKEGDEDSSLQKEDDDSPPENQMEEDQVKEDSDHQVEADVKLEFDDKDEEQNEDMALSPLVEETDIENKEECDDENSSMNESRRSKRHLAKEGEFLEIGDDDDFLLEEESLQETKPNILPPNVPAKPQMAWPLRTVPLKDMAVKRTAIAEDTKDPDPLMDNSFFNTRQEFLSLCQGNKYQFDQLRRAKHSSMMVLYHLHNPDESAFVISCNGCNQEIKDESWYKCQECDEVDFCKSCYNRPNVHKHPCSIHFARSKRDVAQQQNIRDHMILLVHASGCTNPACDFTNCTKMKQLLNHGRSCSKGYKECRICKRIFMLLQIHARQCRVPHGHCPVDRCADFKEVIRRQSTMVQDRRIRAQNDRINQERLNQESMDQQPAPPVAQYSPTNYGNHQHSTIRRGSSGMGKSERPGKFITN